MRETFRLWLTVFALVYGMCLVGIAITIIVYLLTGNDGIAFVACFTYALSVFVATGIVAAMRTGE